VWVAHPYPGGFECNRWLPQQPLFFGPLASLSTGRFAMLRRYGCTVWITEAELLAMFESP
jgi:hypothetical protein